eukprot:TRINITY_DN291_c0_g1_i4.p3 TRINITY_DN291_c0_g1~~TRINITY_DN291_c0_g1_i4.p3  ORF type:complete len:555 (-),score=210.96 TRINITY_DN291_c0_g1_i4:1973-3637(-)
MGNIRKIKIMRTAFVLLLLCGAAFSQWEDFETSVELESFDNVAYTDMDNFEVLDQMIEEEPVELIKCLPGFYQQTNSTNNKTKCLRCPAGCISCKDGTACQKCRPSFNLTGGKCIRKPNSIFNLDKRNVTWPKNNKTNSSNVTRPRLELEETELTFEEAQPLELLKCLPGFYEYKNKTTGKPQSCNRCYPGCAQCTNRHPCLVCRPGYKLNANGRCDRAGGNGTRNNVSWPKANSSKPNKNNQAKLEFENIEDFEATTDQETFELGFEDVDFETESVFEEFESTTNMDTFELEQDNIDTLEQFLDEDSVELIKCLPGFYQQTNSTNNKTKCLRCPAGCAKCNDGTACQKCRPSFNLTGGKCIRKPNSIFNLDKRNVTWPKNNKTNSSNTTRPRLELEETEFTFEEEPVELVKCLPGFFKANNSTKCERCGRGCISCTSKQACTKCLKTFSLKDGKCTGGLLNIGNANRPNITWPKKNNTGKDNKNNGTPATKLEYEQDNYWEEFEAAMAQADPQRSDNTSRVMKSYCFIDCQSFHHPYVIILLYTSQILSLIVQ